MVYKEIEENLIREQLKGFLVEWKNLTSDTDVSGHLILHLFSKEGRSVNIVRGLKAVYIDCEEIELDDIELYLVKKIIAAISYRLPYIIAAMRKEIGKFDSLNNKINDVAIKEIKR